MKNHSSFFPQKLYGNSYNRTFYGNGSSYKFLFCCLYKVAPEQKARATYDNILALADDPDVIDPIRFLREREVVHFQRFGEALRRVTDLQDSKKYY